MSNRVIFHIDLNSFFATAEMIQNPALVGLPMVVGGGSRRSVVSTASYEARAYGIHSGMAISQAEKLCKNLIIVKGDFALYERLSNQFLSYIKTYTPLIEQASIDECYADMTEVIKKYHRPLDLAVKIQKELLELFQLKCSIGISYNKFLAKMASEMKKPMGITVIRKKELPIKVWPLSIKDMYGVGKKTSPHLVKSGIETIGDLANEKNIEAARRIFGKNYMNYYLRSIGEGDDEIEAPQDAKSIGQSTTLQDDITEYDEVKQTLFYLAKKIAVRLLKYNYSLNHISLTIRYYDFENIARSRKLEHRISTANEILEEALSIYDENENEKPIRLLGISCSGLQSIQQSTKQISLFEAVNDDKEDETDNLIKEINKKLSKAKLTRASKIKKSSS